MKHGDFTELAKFYVDRPGYSLELLKMIKNHIMQEQGVESVCAADVGAGTGKLTENLVQIGVKGYAVEPNDAMRAEGIKLFAEKDTFVWSKGSAEMTALPDECVDWVLMGSSFHWADARAQGCGRVQADTETWRIFYCNMESERYQKKRDSYGN